MRAVHSRRASLQRLGRSNSDLGAVVCISAAPKPGILAPTLAACYRRVEGIIGAPLSPFEPPPSLGERVLERTLSRRGRQVHHVLAHFTGSCKQGIHDHMMS
jgi:hypothetical protein